MVFCVDEKVPLHMAQGQKGSKRKMASAQQVIFQFRKWGHSQ